MKTPTIAIDLAKALFQVHGVDPHEKVGLRKQLKRKDMWSFFANLEPCLIAIKACGTAHCRARNLPAFGPKPPALDLVLTILDLRQRIVIRMAIG